MGSNGAESQAIYEAEDRLWRLRILWAQVHGVEVYRGEQEGVAAITRSFLASDSKGCYDATMRQEGPSSG